MGVPQDIVSVFQQGGFAVRSGRIIGSSSGGLFAAPISETIDNCELWTIEIGRPPAFGFYGSKSIQPVSKVLVACPVREGLTMTINGFEVDDDEWKESI